MKKSFLIQRAKFSTRKHTPDILKGIDRLLEYDYMASDYFNTEFGGSPLAASLKRVRENLPDYVLFIFHPSAVLLPLHVLCKQADALAVRAELTKIADGKAALHRYCDLGKYLSGQEGNDFWWDIENDFFFWKKNEQFATRFTNALAQ